MIAVVTPEFIDNEPSMNHRVGSVHHRQQHYRGRVAIVCVPAACFAFAAISPAAKAQPLSETWPVAVHARYKLKYNGIEVGQLNVTSKRTETTYSLSGSGKVSVLFGAITWSGSSNVTGQIVGGIPQPVKYAFEWKNNRKGGTIDMAYKDRVAADVKVVPPPDPHPDLVPVQPQHRAGMFDPVSALLMLTRADGRAPCERQVGIFDGKQRYDLVLTFKRHTNLPAGPGTQKGELAYVCRAMYVPVAGHRDNAATKTYASNKDVEVVIRRVPGSQLLIPHSVHIPTMWGSGTMVTDHVEVTTAAGARIAFGR